jgi:hypothetical protein
MDSREGLHRTVVLRGGAELAEPSAPPPFVAPSSAFFSPSTPCLAGGFRVSKQMIPSKQSSSPSFSRTLAAWALSELVKICRMEAAVVSDYNTDAMQVVTVHPDDTVETREMGKSERAHYLPLWQGKQQLPQHRVRLQLLVRKGSMDTSVKVVVIKIITQNLLRDNRNRKAENGYKKNPKLLTNKLFMFGGQR